MTKIAVNKEVGARGICAVIDDENTILPLLAKDNTDGTSTLKVILYATQIDGTITPVRCDANGQLKTIAGS